MMDLAQKQYEQRVRIDRISLLLIVILWPGWWYVVRAGEPVAEDPFWLRLLIGGLALISLVGTYLSGYLRERTQSLVLFSSSLVTINLLVLCEWNHFEGIYLVGPLAAFFSISYAFTSTSHLQIYTILTNVVILVLLVYDYNTNKLMVLAGTLTVAIVMIAHQYSSSLLMAEVITSRARLSTILEQIPVGVIFREDDQVYLNSETARILDLPPGPPTEQVVDKRLSQANPVGFDEQFVEDMSSDEFLWRKYSYIDDAGELRYFDCKVLDDRPERRFLVITDETRVTKMRQRMLNTSKMASMGLLAGGIAHEINNPLTIVKATAAMLLLRENLSENAQKMVQKIGATVDRMAEIVRGLLTFAREKEVDALSVVRIEAVVSQTMDLCRERLENRGIELVLQGDNEIEIKANLVSASQCLLNLISNAADSLETAAKKVITISAERESNGDVILAVTDSGPGIAEQDAARIMEPFFTTKAVGRGTGLGLSVTQGLMEGQGGSLQYAPGPTGCRFELHFQAPK